MTGLEAIVSAIIVIRAFFASSAHVRNCLPFRRAAHFANFKESDDEQDGDSVHVGTSDVGARIPRMRAGMHAHDAACMGAHPRQVQRARCLMHII